MQRTKMPPTHRLTRTYEEEEETKPQIEGEGDSESTLDLPSKRVLNTTYREYKHMLNSTTAVTSTCCGVYCKKSTGVQTIVELSVDSGRGHGESYFGRIVLCVLHPFDLVIRREPHHVVSIYG